MPMAIRISHANGDALEDNIKEFSREIPADMLKSSELLEPQQVQNLLVNAIQFTPPSAFYTNPY